MRRDIDVALGILVLICLLPLAAVFLSDWIARANGCTLNEGNVHPCIVWGRDVGEVLYMGFVSGWFMLLTLPIAAVLAATLGVRMLMRLLRRG